MDGQRPGSFMAPAGGGGSVLLEAMARRGLGGNGITNQSTSSSSAVLPAAPPPPSAAIPAGVFSQGGAPAPQPQGAQPPQPPQAPQQAQMGGTPVGNPEASMIIKAMQERLDTINRIEETKAGIQ